MTSSATKLHDLLAEVRNGSGTLTSVWGEALGSDYGSAEFPQKFSEVVSLFNDTCDSISLLKDQTAERLLPYEHEWFSAMIGVGIDWNTNRPSWRDLLDRPSLDQLALAGELVEARFEGTPLSPVGEDLSRIRQECQQLSELVSESEIDPALRKVLRGQLNNLIWLVDNAETFGPARVVAASQVLLGTTATAANTVQDEGERSTWRTRVTALFAAIGMFTTGAATVQTAITSVGDVVKALDTTTHVVQQFGHEPAPGTESP